MAKHEIRTLCSITGQGEDDVVAMLKKYGGDMDAATNALIDSESTARNPPDCSFAGALLHDRRKTKWRGIDLTRAPPARALLAHTRADRHPPVTPDPAVEKFETVAKKGTKKKDVSDPASTAARAFPAGGGVLPAIGNLA
uniref:hypothetical protein n=1 Tax=Cephaloticoccus sp. TaxID=1985742 RepID=UPI00404A273E